jgi:hypothetical protein
MPGDLIFWNHTRKQATMHYSKDGHTVFVVITAGVQKIF